jgi:hypothetical protein
VRAAGACVALLLLAACAGPSAPGARSGSFRAPDFAPAQIRRPAVFVRVALGPGPWSERERRDLAALYEGALLEALNARAVAAGDVRSGPDTPPDEPAALARARAVGADHAILVAVRVDRGPRRFCLDGRRPFEATATVWRQQARVFRASDGAMRLAVEPDALTVSDVEADCDDPRASRRRSPDETVGEAVSRLLGRLLGSG